MTGNQTSNTKVSKAIFTPQMVIRVCAELAGTFLVTFALYIVGTLGQVLYGASVLFVALATGLAYAAGSALFGRISGAHFNPAVTIAAVFTGKLGWLEGIFYLIAQVLGAIASAAIVVGFLPTSTTVTSSMWLTSAVNGFEKGSVSNSMLSQAGITFSVTMAIILEIIAGLIVVGAVVTTLNNHGGADKRHVLYSGIAYGIAAAITFPITGAGLNPARSTGIAIFAQNKGLSQEPLQQLWVFWICPILAAAIVALVLILTNMVKASVASSAIASTEDDEDADDVIADEIVYTSETPEYASDDNAVEDSTDNVAADVSANVADDVDSEQQANAEVSNEETKA
ncbi:MAG: aquaporin [Bifidobacterium sp.]|jgi:aquaporin Z|nr:aquaporin [Bifidobacterium sp.]MCH4174322.1 aquaporin [Bifidobacterium sp.]